MNHLRRARLSNRDVASNLLAHRDFLAPVSDTILLNLSNVPDESHTKPRSTLFGPLLEQPKSNASGQNKKPLPVEKKVIAPTVVQTWVDRSKDVSIRHIVSCIICSPLYSTDESAFLMGLN